MRFPLVKSDHFVASILCLMVCWCVCTGGAPSFKGDDGKTETLEVGKGAAEKSLLCIVKTDSGRYRWFKNGRIIGVNTNMKKYRIKKYRYLKIKNIKINDQGVYVCQYNYGDNYVNKTIYLNVFEAPYFTHKEEMIAEQEFDEQKPPVLVCKADGNPKPTVVWYKDDERVTSKSGEISADRFTFRVMSPDEKSKLTYRCFVSNKYGNLSYEFVIEVPETTRFAPIIQDIKNQTVVVGGRLNVECTAAANEQPEFNLVELLPNGSLVPVEIGEKIKRRLVQPQDENKVRWYSVWWDFENVSFADQKYYACMAKSHISVAKQKFYVFVTPKVSPNPPTPYKLKKVSGTQRNSIIGIICAIIVGPAIIGVVVCVIITRRRSKHIREASFERYQTKMLEEPDVSSSNPQPSATCWKQISYTPQTHSSRDLEMLMVASDTATENSAKTQSLQESLV